MGSVRDRIAIFESIANQKEQLGSEDGSQHLPVEIIVTPVTPTPRQDEEEDDNLPHSEDDDKAHEKEPKEKHEGAPGSQSESDGSDDDDADDGKPRKPRKVRRTTDKITKTSYHIKKEGREGFDGNEGDEGETTGYNVPSVTIEQPHDLEHEDDYQKTTVTTVTTSMREVPEDRESETREDLESETESIGEDGQPIKRRKVRRITETVTETSYHVKKEGKGDEEAGHPHQTGELPEQDDGRSLETEHADEGEHVEHLSPPASPVPLHEHVEDERTTFVHDDELKAASEPREEYSGSEVESINSDGQPVRRKKVRHTRETITSTSYQVKKEGKEDENTETAHETEALLGRDGEGALEQVHVVEGDHVEHLSPPASPVPLHEHIEDEKTTFVHDDELGGAHDQEEDYSGSEVESINSDGQPIRRKKVRHTRETITSTSYHVKKEGKQSDLEQPSEQDLREHRERPQSADEIDETVKATATATPNVLADDDRHQADLLETGYEKKEVSEEEMETIEPSEADYEDTSKLAQLRTSPTETKQQKLPTEGMTDSFYAVSDESEVEEVKLAEIRTTSSDDFSPVKHTAGEYEQPAKEYEDASESAEIRHSDSRDLMTTSVYAESDEGASEGTKFAEIRKSPSDEELEHHKKVAGTVDTEPHREASPELSEKFGDIAKTAGMVAGGVIAAPFALAALGAKGIYDKLTDQDTTDDTTADTYEHHERYEQTHRESPIDEHHVLRESPLPETAVEEHAYPQEEHHEHFEEAEHHELLKESPQPESPIDDREQKHPEEAVVYEEHHEHFEETHRESPADEHHLLRESPLPEAAVEEHAYPQEEHQEHAYPQEEPHEHFEEAEHHELLKESPQPASPIDDREHTHPEETVGHEEHHEHFEETHRESPADEHHLLRESPLPEAAVEEHAYPQEEPHGHFEEAEHHELLKESPQPESPIDDREHTHPEETVGHEEHHEHFEETHRESPADEHHLLRESPLPEAAVEEHAYPQEKHHEHFEEAEHHELLKESPQPESTVDDREHTHPEETVGHEEHHEQFEETHRESPANEHHLLRESPLPEAAVEEHAYPQEEHQEHAYPQEEHHEHFEEAEHHELLKESPQPESSIDDREQTHPEEAVVYEEHHEHFEETHRESPADEHHLLRESPLPEAAVEEHAYPQEEHQEHAYPQEEHHEHFEEAEHHELLKESPQPESPIDDREQTHPEEAVVCEEHHEHFEETHRESPADEHHLLRESPLPEAAVEEHAYPQEEHQEHAYPQEEHHEHFEEAEHHELLKESPQPESPIDDREQTHPEEAVVYEEHHEHFEETHRESPADEHHLLRESPLPEAAVEEHAYSQEEHHEHFEEAEHHELLKESPQPESPVDDREHTHSEETVVHEEHHTQYEETHREEAGEHEPEEKSFGDKLTGFAKKAGLVAGGVIAAPIALAALGAKEAYDTLKQKQTEDDLEEHYEQESSQSQYASEHTEHFEVTQQESPVDEHHFVPESPQAESAIAAERQFMHEPEQRDHEQFEDILQKSQIEEHDLVKESSQPESSIVVEHELVPEPGHFEHYEHYEETHQKSPVDEHHFVPESPQAESPIAAERQFMHEPEERDHEQFEDILQKSQIEEHDLVKESSQPESPIVAELELVPEPGHLEHYEHYEETQQKSPVDEHHFVPESPQAESPIAAERQFMHEPEERDHEQFEDILQKSQIEEHEYVKKSSQPESPIVAEHERVPEPGHLEHYEHYEHYEETQQKSPVDEHHFVPESPQAESPIAAERQFMHEPEERNHEQVEDILQKSQIEENDLVKESSLPESPIVAEHELVPEPGHLEHYEHYEETQQKSPVDEHHFVPESPQAKSPIAAERQFMHEPEERDHEQFEDILQKSQIEEHEYVKKSSQPESPIVAEHERVPEPGHLEHYEHYEHYEETQQKSPVDEHHFVPESPQAESPIAAERQFMHEPEERNHEQVEDILQKSQIEENDLVKESSLPESPIVAEHELVPEPGHLEHYEHYEETQQKSPVDEHHFVPESPQAESPIAAERQFMHEPEERDHEQFEDILQKSQIEEHDLVRESPQPESPIVAEHELVPEPGHLEHYEHYEVTQQESPVDEHHFVPESPQAESPIAAERQFMHEPEQRDHEQFEDILQKSQIEEHDLVRESPQPESPIVAEHELVPEPGHLEHYEHYEETQQSSPDHEQHLGRESPLAESPIATERESAHHEPDHREDYEHLEDTQHKYSDDKPHYLQEHEKSAYAEENIARPDDEMESGTTDERSFGDKLTGFAKKAGLVAGGVIAAPIALAALGAKGAYDSLKHQQEEDDNGEAEYEQRSEKTTTPVDKQLSSHAESPIVSEREFAHEPDHQEHFEHYEETEQKSPIEEQHFVKESPQAESPIVSEREFAHEPDHHEHFEETQQRSPVEEQLFVKESPQAESPIASEREFMHEPDHQEHYEHFEDTEQRSPVEEQHFVKESPQAESPIASEREFMHEPDHQEHYEHYEDTEQRSPVEEQHFVKKSPQAESPIASEREFVHEPDHQEHYEHFEDTQQRSPIEEQHFVKESPQAESPIVSEREFTHEPDHHEHFEETQQRSPIEEQLFVKESPQAESPIVSEREFMHEPDHQEHYEHYEETEQRSPVEEQHFVKESPQAESPIVSEREFTHEPDHHEHFEETQQRSPIEEQHFVKESPQAESPIVSEREFAHEPDHHEHFEEAEQRSPVEEQHFVKESPQAESPIASEREFMHEPDHQEHYEHYEETETRSPVEEQHFLKESHQAESPIASEREFMHEPDHQEHYEHYEESERRSPVGEQHFVKESPQAESPIASEREFMHEPDHHEHYEHFEETQQRSSVEEQLFVKESPQAESPIASEQEFAHEPDHQEHYEHYEEPQQRSPVEEQHFVEESPQAESPISSERELAHEPDHQEHYKHFEETQQRSSVGEVGEQHSVEESPPAESPYYEEQPKRSQEDMEEGPTDGRSFGDKLTGFAKKAGLVAGGVIAAPIALAALGAKEAYDSLKKSGGEDHQFDDKTQEEFPIIRKDSNIPEDSSQYERHESYEDSQENSDVGARLFEKEVPQAESPTVDARLYTSEDSVQEHYEHHEETHRESPVDQHHFEKEVPQAESPTVDAHVYAPEDSVQQHYEHHEETQRESPVDQHHFEKEVPQAESPVDAGVNTPEDSVQEQLEHHEETHRESPVDQHHFEKDVPQAESPTVDAHVYTPEDSVQEHYEHHEETQRESPVDQHHFEKEVPQAESPTVDAHVYAPDDSVQQHYEHHEETQRESPVDQHHFEKEVPQAESPVDAGVNTPEDSVQEQLEHHEETHRESPVDQHHFEKEVPQAESPTVDAHVYTPEDSVQEHYEHHEETQRESPADQHHFEKEVPQAESPTVDAHVYTPEDSVQEHYEHHEETQRESPVDQHHFEEEVPQAESSTVDTRAYTHEDSVQEHYEGTQEYPVDRKDATEYTETTITTVITTFEEPIDYDREEQALSPNQDAHREDRAYAPEDSVQEHQDHHEKTERETPVDQQPFGKEEPQAESPKDSAHYLEDSVQGHHEDESPTVEHHTPEDYIREHHAHSEEPHVDRGDATEYTETTITTVITTFEEPIDHQEEDQTLYSDQDAHAEYANPEQKAHPIEYTETTVTMTTTETAEAPFSVDQRASSPEIEERLPEVGDDERTRDSQLIESPDFEAFGRIADQILAESIKDLDNIRESDDEEDTSHLMERKISNADEHVGETSPLEDSQSGTEKSPSFGSKVFGFAKKAGMIAGGAVAAPVALAALGAKHTYDAIKNKGSTETGYTEVPTEEDHFAKDNESESEEEHDLQSEQYTTQEPTTHIIPSEDYGQDSQFERPISPALHVLDESRAEEHKLDTSATTQIGYAHDEHEATFGEQPHRSPSSESVTEAAHVIPSQDYEQESQFERPISPADHEDHELEQKTTEEHQVGTFKETEIGYEHDEPETTFEEQQLRSPSAESVTEATHIIQSGDYDQEAQFERPSSPVDHKEHELEEPTMGEHQLDTSAQKEIGFEHDELEATFEEQPHRSPSSESVTEAAHLIPSEDYEQESEFERPTSPADHREHELEEPTTEKRQLNTSAQREIGFEHDEHEATFEKQPHRSPSSESVTEAAHLIPSEDYEQESEFERPTSPADHREHELEEPTTEKRQLDIFAQREIGFEHNEHEAIFEEQQQSPSSESAPEAAHVIPSGDYVQESEFERPSSPADHREHKLEEPTTEEHQLNTSAQREIGFEHDEHDAIEEQQQRPPSSESATEAAHVIPSGDYEQESEFERPTSPADHREHELEEPTMKEHQLDTSAQREIGFEHDEHDAIEKQQQRPPSSGSATEAAHVIPSEDYEQESLFERPISPADHEEHELEQYITEHQVDTSKEREIGYEHHEPEATFEEQQLRSPSAESVTGATHIIQSENYDQESQFERPISPADHEEHELAHPTTEEQNFDTTSQGVIGFEHDEHDATFGEQQQQPPSSESTTKAAHVIPSENYEQESQFERPISPADHEKYELVDTTTEEPIGTPSRPELELQYNDQETADLEQVHEDSTQSIIADSQKTAGLVAGGVLAAPVVFGAYGVVELYENVSEPTKTETRSEPTTGLRVVSPSDQEEHELEQPTREEHKLDTSSQGVIGFEHDEHDATFEEQQQRPPSSESATGAAHVIPSDEYDQESQFERPISPVDHTRAEQVGAATQQELELYQREHEPTRLAETPEDSAGNKIIDFAKKAGLVAGGVLAAPVVLGAYGMKELYAAVSETSEEPKLDTAEHRNLGYEHDEHDATFEEQQQRPPSSESATEAAHVIPSEDYEQESQFERPISPADHEEHALEHPTTEEHNLDTSPQEVTGYEHDEHDATFEEQQQRPPSSESTTETAHVIPSEDYEQESQFERPISPADYEEHELEQPTTEEHKLETSSQGVIGYEHDEHDATFEEQQQRPPSSESTTEAAHVIRSEDYEQEVQFERPISPGDYEEHELAQHTTEEHKLDTSSQGEIVYEHDEHDATFEEQQQRPPSSESTTEAAHVIPSEDYEQEVQFERPISPGDYEEHEIAQHTTEEHKLDTSSQGEIVYEHDEHDATFEEQQQRPPSSESTTEAAHVIPSDNYEQESQFERPISPGDYEERELEQPTTEELKLETSAPTEIGYEQDEHDATFEEQQQRPSSSESATGAVHVITPEGYEQESQFERPISADHEEHELVETATADSKVTHTTKMADLVAGGVLVAPVVFGAYGVVALYEDVSEPARIETQSEPTTDFDNIDSAAYENVARMNLTDPEHYESSTKQSEVKLSSEDDETKNIANDSEWKVFNSKGEVVEEFSAQLAEDVITGATEETSSPQPPRKLLKQESSNEIRMEPEVDYQSDLQEKLDILATQSRNDLPILKEEEGLSIVHEEHEVEEDLPTPDTQVVNESAAKLVDDVLNAITTEEASTQPSSDFVTATEQSKDYETCVTSQTDTFQSAQQWTSQDSEYTTAPSDSTSRPDTREELVEPSTPTVLVSPIEPERPFSASDRPGIPFVFKQFDTDSKRSTPDVTLQIEGEDDELEGVLQTSASGVLQLPDMDPGRPTSPIPPRRTDSGIFIGTKQPEDTITVIQCMTPDILDATEEKINPLLRKVLPGPSETSIHDRAMEIEDTSSQYSRQISDVSSSSRADTVIQNEQYEEPIDITEELLASQIGADSIDSLDKVSMKSGGSGKRYSTSRRSSGASAKTPEREAVDFEHFGETEESVLKTEPEDVAADFEITEETPTSPDAENIEETYETFTQEEVQSLEPELETLHEEPEDSDSLNGSGSSVGAPVDTIALLGKYKHMSSDNISESSLQEFERIEQAVMNKGESSLTSSELELYLAGTAGRLIRSGEGSTNSLTEFEKLEQEVGKESPPQEDVMMLSDIREESEAEDMSVRDDEEGDNDSVSDVKIVPVNEDEERIVTPTALSNADSIEKDIDMISSVHLLETSTDSLEPTGAAVLSTQRRDSLEETSLAEYEVISKMNESMRDSLENIPHDTDSLLEGASQDVLTSQDTQGLLSGDTVGTYQEHDDDKDSLTGEMDTMLSSYPTTLTTFETTQVKDDGTVETISRRVETRVRDPVMSHVQFTGTESEERVKQLPVEEQFETVDEEGNVTRTIVKRQSPQHH